MTIYESFPKVESKSVSEQVEHTIMNRMEEFLDEQVSFISEHTHAVLPDLVKEQVQTLADSWNHAEVNSVVSYDKYKKSFVAGTTPATAGEIIASRHWGHAYAFPEKLDASIQGKNARKNALAYHTTDTITEKLNHELATRFVVEYQNKDLLKAEAFQEVAKRTDGNKSEQLGVFAEAIMQGVIETFAIDREDLGITVLPGNAYQDVIDKIDFIIATKQKKRGVGIEQADLSDEKHIGIQFTINTSKAVHKQDQIEKAKARGTHMDDIIYVAIDKKELSTAVEKWKKDGKNIRGPWNYLSADIRKNAIHALLGSVITPEQEQSIIKILCK